MHRVDVDRMMASISARQYKEWEAYERATGPLDATYEREMQAQQHELLQFNNILTGASLTKKGKKNPAGKFRNAFRPQAFTNPYLEVETPEPDDTDGDELEELYDGYDDEDEYEAEEEVLYEPPDPNAYDPSKDPFASMPG